MNLASDGGVASSKGFTVIRAATKGERQANCTRYQKECIVGSYAHSFHTRALLYTTSVG